MRRFDFPWAALAGALITLAVMTAWRAVPADDSCPVDKVITVAGGRDVSTDRQRHKAIDAWRGPAGERARLRELSGVADLQHSQLIASAQSRGCDDDVYILDVQWIPEFARGRYITAIDPDTVELGRFLPVLRAAGRYDGTLWSVPFNTDAALLYYRADLLSQAGLRPPRSWTELWRQARTLPSRPETGLTGGYTAQLAPYEGLTVNALELIWGAGGDVVDGRGNVTVDRPPARRALQQLIDGLGGERPLISRAALDHHEDSSIREFESGAVAFMRNWPYAYGALANNPDMRGRFGVTTLPGASVLGGQNLAVAASSPEKGAALSLIAHLTGVEAQRRLFTCGGFAPVRGEVYAAPGECPDQPTTPGRDRVVRHVPDTAMLRRAVETARPRPAGPYYNEFSRTLQRRLHERLQCLDLSVCDQSADLKSFTDSLADDLRRSLRGH
ncbi:extracellular solute-binding protein [Actinomadura alba]|uniref:extracellular solute-binding protein n=1 Tax=Actinomadura alba TaxID=406431 RepID=UPI0031D77084